MGEEGGTSNFSYVKCKTQAKSYGGRRVLCHVFICRTVARQTNQGSRGSSGRAQGEPTVRGSIARVQICSEGMESCCASGLHFPCPNVTFLLQVRTTRDFIRRITYD